MCVLCFILNSLYSKIMMEVILACALGLSMDVQEGAVRRIVEAVYKVFASINPAAEASLNPFNLVLSTNVKLVCDFWTALFVVSNR